MRGRGSTASSGGETGRFRPAQRALAACLAASAAAAPAGARSAPAGASAGAPAVPVRVDGRELVASALGSRPATVDLGRLGRFRVSLEPVELRAPGARFTITDARGLFRPAKPEPVTTLQGTVTGVPGSLVALTVTADWVAGFIHTPGVTVAVEPASFSRPRGGLVARKADPAAPIPVGDDELLPPDTSPSAPASHGPLSVNGAFLNCSVRACGRLVALAILDADVSYRNIDPSSCFSRQLAIFNGVNAIFRRDVNVELRVSQQNCRTSTAGLGAAGTDPETYLKNLTGAWRGVGPDRSYVSLAVGYDFGAGKAIGTAWIRGVCHRTEPDPLLVVDFANRCEYGVNLWQAVPRPNSNYTASTFLQTKLAAHETGHNFDGWHELADNCNNAVKTTAPRRGTILCAVIQQDGPNVFSQRNHDAIRRWAEEKIGSV